jgi:hypothetical protein
LRGRHVALGFDQRRLAIHHAGAARLAQLFDHLGGNVSHRMYPCITPNAYAIGGAI